ncbi:MAG: hypothetical protein ABFC77_14445 [Thermoguttaceae bacterium]
MSVAGIIALPCIVMILAFGVAISAAYRSQSSARFLFLYPLMGSFVITGGCMMWGYHAICTSRSSTAAIGLFFLPLFSAALAVIVFAVSWAVLYVGWFLVQRIQAVPVRPVSIAILFLAIVVLAWTGYMAQTKIARHRLLKEATLGRKVERLEAILTEGVSSQDFETLAKLAKNPNTPTSDLIRLYDFCRPRISELGGSESLILVALAKNPQTPPDILAALASCRQPWIRDHVAANPNTSIGTLRQLAADQEQFVRGHAARELRAREQNREFETQ